MTGQRERAKARRRDRIQRAAYQLFAQQGFDATTVAEIAERAEVSTRTVSLYFASKADLVLSERNAAAQRLTAAFNGRDAEQDAIDVLGGWLLDESALGDPGLTALSRTMFAADPNLKAMTSVPIAESVRVALKALAIDLGLSVDDPVVRLVGAAIGGIVLEYGDLAVEGPAARTLHAAATAMMRAVVSSARPKGESEPD